MTNRVAKNVLVNFLGRGWGALLSIALTPVYIKFLGIESYGLIGVFLTLQTLLSILDMGLGMAANREMAVLSAREGNLPQMRNLVRTLEWIYWVVAVCIVIAVGLLAYPIAYAWVKPQELHPSEINTAITLMGVVLAAQWPSGLYGGALMGLQQQALLNGMNALFATVRGVGAVVVLWKVSADIQTFFVWQATLSVIQTFAVGRILWWQIALSNCPPRFDGKILHAIKNFAFGMVGISISTVILTQLDKVILSKMLPLETFGYYSLATTVAGAMYILISPVFAAVFPKFSQLVKNQDKEGVVRLYYQSSQLMMVIIIPAAIVIAVFSYEILLLWTRNQELAERTYLILSLLVIGNTLNGLMNVPYALQLANGWTRLAFWSNVGAIIFIGPAIWYGSIFYGAEGAAAAWLILSFMSMVIGLPIVHKKFLPFDAWKNYLREGIAPVLPALFLVAIAYPFVPRGASDSAQAMLILLALALCYALTISFSKYIRAGLVHYFSLRFCK